MTSRASRLVLVLCVLTALLGAQSSAALFDAPVIVGTDYTRLLNVLDFDGDGWKDAISCWYPPNSTSAVVVQGWRNDQTGRLVNPWGASHIMGTGPTLLDVDIATGDMNLDGLDDFVLNIAGTIYLYLSNGTAPPTLWATMSAGFWSSAIRMADFNGDGRADIALLGSGVVKIFLVQPSGPPFPTSSMGTPSGALTLFLAEVNGDGVMDVGVAGASTGTQLRLHPVVGGVLQPPLSFVLPGETMPMPAAGDVDNDGDQDIVVFGMTHYWTLRRTSPTTFNLESAVLGGPATALADVDQDGDLDGVCCGGGGGGGSPPNYYISHFEIAINNGGGAFAPSFTITGLGSTRIAGVADMDGDGDVDLVAGRCIYFPDGPITKSPLQAIPASVSNGRSVFDVDQDGDPDLQWTVGLGIAVSRNDGNGLIAPAPLLLPTPPAGSVWEGPGWPGDWDGDGDVDLVVVQRTAAGGGAFIAMRLLRNNSGGGYTDGGNAAGAGVDMRTMPAMPVFVPMSPENSLAADVDLDGDLDLVCRVVGPWIGTRIWFNSGGGFFSPGQSIPGNYVVAVAPIDANATPDLLGVYGGGSGGVGPLRLSRGLGGGAFADPDAVAIVALAASWNDFTLADLDGDGDLDLATFSGASAVVWQNDGNGVFAPASPPLVQLIDPDAYSPHHISIIDVDLDGHLDVVVGPVENTGGVGSAIYRGTATPWVFQPKVAQVIGTAVLTDVDGDGDRDALGNYLTRNRHFRQPDCGLRRQYGTGLAGSGGMVPVLGAVGPFRVGVSGDTRIRGGRGGAHALFGIGAYETSTPILGGTLYTDPIVIFEFDLLGNPGVAGAGWVNLPWTLGPGLAGTPFFQQVGIIDPGAPQGASLTNGLHSVIGP